MVLDADKSRTYDCETCDLALQVNRNCSNAFDPTVIKLNDNIYRQCPRSLIFNCREERYLVDLYFDCKDKGIYPSPGSLFSQTSFTQDLFDFIDPIVNTHRNKKHKELEAQLKKQSSQSNSLKKTN